MDIIEIIKNFTFEGEFAALKAFGAGHINSTYLANFTHAGEEKRYVVQKINTSVFKNPRELMHNVFAVTEYLRNILKANGGDASRETLHFMKTRTGDDYYTTPAGECYRAYQYVENSICYERADTPVLFGKSGTAFGKFQKMLANFPAQTLYETIPHFHHTPWRFENEFLPALRKAQKALLQECESEIAFITARRPDMEVFTALLESGALPLRVTHNDTKLNNVLFDNRTGEALCVIDLDTVMPGLSLYDFGDSIRFGANSAAEDESDLERVQLNLDYFKAYTENYLGEAGDTLTQKEKELLAYSAKLMTLESGMRFLTDYLNGDIYFKTDFPKQNLIRAKNQLKLVSDMESKLDEMNEIVLSVQ